MNRRGILWAAQRLAAVVVMGGCGLLGWAAVRTWRASADINSAQDLALRRQAQAAVPYLALAVRYRPGRAEGWRRLAEFRAFARPQEALQDARRAVAAAPTDWRNWDELGLVQFQLGDSVAARRSLAQAAKQDSGWDAHFQLASLALLLGKQAEFWREIRAALAVVGPAQAPPLLHEAWAECHGDSGRFLALLPRQRARLDAVAAILIMDHGAPLAAARLWRQVRCPRYRFGACRSAVLDLTNRLARLAFAGSYPGWAPPAGAFRPTGGALARAAMGIWNQAAQRRIINASPVRRGAVGDGRFQHPWIGPAFAWSKDGAVYLSRDRGAAPVGAAVRIEFNGYQSDDTGLFGEVVAVRPGRRYKVSYLSRRMTTGRNSGLELVVRSAPGVALARVPARLRVHWRTNRGAFRVPPRDSMVQVLFRFHRPIGQVRMHSVAAVADVQLQEVRR